MRVIAGKYRNRRIETVNDRSLRPTMSVAREAIFNILSHGEFGRDEVLKGTVLDLFCGSGALAIEALSRGAEKVILVDIKQEHLDIARQNIAKIGEEANASFLRADSTNPPPARVACQLAFLDPPYGSGLSLKTLKNIVKNGWLADGAIVVLEADKKEDIPIEGSFELISERLYGKCKLLFLRYKAS